MKQYYSYLLSTTWPSVIVLFLIIVFVFSRLFVKVKTELASAFDLWTGLVLISKLILWLGVLMIYIKMFHVYHPDWFVRPGVIQAEVFGKSHFSDQGYMLDVSNGFEQKSVYVDKLTYQTIQLGERVELLYLPYRMEVVRCEVLP